MAEVTPTWAADLLDVWFTKLDQKDWFRGGDVVDDLLRSKFSGTLDQQSGCPASHFLTDPRTAQAAILLFDQVPRNIHRDTPKAFATDPLALRIAKEFIASGWDNNLPNAQRQFVAMPLMHSENLADQDASVAYFSAHLPENLSFAENHHDAIARFGRFPHRNDILGRQTTPAEAQAIAEGLRW